MPLPERKQLPHDPPLFVRPDEAVFFLTICCEPRGQNQLCVPNAAKAILESVAFLHNRGDWYVHFALLMPDHVHLLASFPSEKAMPRVVAEWKKFVARSCGVRWQRDFFDHRLRCDESMREKTEYIAMNPVRKGLAKEPEKWLYVWTPKT